MLRTLLAAAAALALSAGSAQAATHVASVTMLMPDSILTASGARFYEAVGPFEIASGDTVDLTIDFAGDQEVISSGLFENFLALVYQGAVSPPPIAVTNTGTLTFLDLAGAPIFTTPENVYPGCCHFAGGLIQDYGAAPLPIRYGGMRYVGTVEFASGGPYTFNTLALDFTGDLEVVGTPAIVPEPSAWALMIGGFGLAGATLRRRRGFA